MLDRYDPRDDNHRDRGDSQERSWGSRGGGERAGGRGDEAGVFACQVDMPRGPEREIVRERKRSYELNGQESAALATIAAFRVVQVSDVREMLDDGRGGRAAPKSLEHFRRPACWSVSREYQQFLQERNRGRADSTGRPDRTPGEVAVWAKDHNLPYRDNRVRFPDARIEFEP